MDCHGRHFPTGSDQKPSEVSFIHSRAALLVQLQHSTHFYNYHMSNSHECTVVNGETLQLHTIYRKKKTCFFFYYMSHQNLYQYYKSRDNPYQVSSTTSHIDASEHVMKLKVHMIKNRRYDKIIITIVPSYTRKNITHLFPLTWLLVLRTGNNIDGNKLMISSGIALYYGDTFTRDT